MRRQTTDEPVSVVKARDRLTDARVRKREATANRVQAKSEHRAAAAELQTALHQQGRTGDVVSDLEERRRYAADLARRVEDAKLIEQGAEQGARDATHGVQRALVDAAGDMWNTLTVESDALIAEQQCLEQEHAAFAERVARLVSRYEELLAAPDGPVGLQQWRRDQRGSLELTPDAGYRPRRLGAPHVIAS
jgi:hypothetical protein